MKQFVLFAFLISSVVAFFDDPDIGRWTVVVEAILERAYRPKPIDLEHYDRLMYLDDMKEQCGANGEVDSLQTLMMAQTELEICIEHIFRTTPRLVVQDDDDDTFRTVDNVLFGCRIAHKLANCTLTFYSSTKSCLLPHRRYDIQKLRNVMDSIISYACDNGGERLSSFLSGGGVRCMKLINPKPQDCDILEETDMKNSTADTIEVVSVEPDTPEADCKQATKTVRCLRYLLDLCGMPPVVPFFDGLVKTVANHTICESLKEPVDTSPASPTV